MQQLNAKRAAEANQAFKRLFASHSPYRDPFHETVESRLLLFPTQGTRLSIVQFQAVGNAAHAEHEVEAFLVPVEAMSNISDLEHQEHWLVDLETPSAYIDSSSIALSMEHALFSPSSRWGLVTSDEEHALVGGSSRFVTALASLLPASREQMAAEWIDWWAENAKHGYDVAWLVRLLGDIFGPEESARLLKTHASDEAHALFTARRPGA